MQLKYLNNLYMTAQIGSGNASSLNLGGSQFECRRNTVYHNCVFSWLSSVHPVKCQRNVIQRINVKCYINAVKTRKSRHMCCIFHKYLVLSMCRALWGPTRSLGRLFLSLSTGLYNNIVPCKCTTYLWVWRLTALSTFIHGPDKETMFRLWVARKHKCSWHESSSP
jgi:hypothetical protein